MTIFDFLQHPWSLLHETISDVPYDRGLRWTAWALDMMILSVAMPLLIGAVARAVSFRKDADDAPRKPISDYMFKSDPSPNDGPMFARRRDSSTRYPLVMVSPEPEPLIYPE